MSEVEKLITQLKRDAKRISKAQNISHSKALDQLALERGFRNWGLLHNEYSKNGIPVEKLSSTRSR